MHQLQTESFGHTLLACARLLDTLAHDEMNHHAGRVVARPALVRLVPHLSSGGIRPGELARRTDVSKQSVSQTLAPLVEQGLVEYVDDPNDGRARHVRLTSKGNEAFGHALSVLSQFERALAARVGSARLTALFEGLKAIQPVLEEWAQGEAPGVNHARPSPKARRRHRFRYPTG